MRRILTAHYRPRDIRDAHLDGALVSVLTQTATHATIYTYASETLTVRLSELEPLVTTEGE